MQYRAFVKIVHRPSHTNKMSEHTALHNPPNTTGLWGDIPLDQFEKTKRTLSMSPVGERHLIRY